MDGRGPEPAVPVSEQVRDGHYVGALRGTLRLAGLTLAETTYTPGLVVGAHAHESSLALLVLDGALTEERGRRSLLFERNALMVHPADEPHSQHFLGKGGRCFVMQFGAPWRDRLRELGLAEPGEPAHHRRTKAAWLAAQVHREFARTDTAAPLAIEGFAVAMLAEIVRAGARRERGAKPPWLVRTLELLHDRLHDPPSLTELALAVGVHPVHLSRAFRQYVGLTMGEYVRHQRVELARGELLRTDRSLADIAYAFGFADQAHFSRVFKRITGVTPGAWRREALARERSRAPR